MNRNKEYIWMEAASFAARRHRSQSRKDGATPYIAHPFRVAMVVRDIFGADDPEVLAAALLHDTIEDTDTDYDDIAKAFGENVADIVAALTKDMRLPKSAREPAYDRQLEASNWQARLIKLADVYDNLSDAATSRKQVKAGDKAARAIKLAENDEELRGAVQKLKDLVKRLAEEQGE